jgi:hypothetical protein
MNDQQNMGLPVLPPCRLTGTEPLHRNRENLLLTVLDFWQWSASDFLSNLTRGRLAEFIVAHALDIDVRTGVRNEWDAFDLITRSGVKVEVKSSAYLQSWHQKQLSAISWRLGPTRSWDAATNVFSPDLRWNADVYVLALFEQQEKELVDPLDVMRWRFFVVSVRSLQHRSEKHVLTLRAVKALVGDGVGYDALAKAVEEAAK